MSENGVSIKFFVPGIPKPGGSKKGIYNKNTGRVMIFDACNKNKQWRDSVMAVAAEHYPGKLLDTPLRLTVVFQMPRPKYHFKKDGSLKPNAPRYHVSAPDCTKLLRSTEDAITKILWHDDSLVAIQQAQKIYTPDIPGAQILIEEI